MSRRDTIIIALLVNAGLLALLFMLAINNGDDSIVDHPEINKTFMENRTQTPGPVNRLQDPIVLVDTNVHDEVDRFLKDLAEEEAAQNYYVDNDSDREPIRESMAIAPPAAKKMPQAVESEHYVEITVKRGDALEKIARSNGTTVEAIKKANNLNSAKLSIGQVLLIPLSTKFETIPPKPVQIAAAVPPKEAEKKVVANIETQYYVVKSGDNPWKIARQFNVKFDDLLNLNNLDEERARNLKIGDRIRVK